MEVIAAEKNIVCTNPPESKTKSGLTLVDNDKKPELGIVHSIGKGELPADISIGDTVVFRRYTDNRIFIEGVEYNFVRFEDIVGILK